MDKVILQDENSGLWYREGSYDLGIIKEQKSYLPLGIREGDRVIDIGGNIGAFTHLALTQGASFVLSFEPEPDNFKLFLRNHKDLIRTKVNAVQAAVIQANGEPVTFYVNLGTNAGMHSTVKHRGRKEIEVKSVPWHGMFLMCPNPTVMKLDIEGGEYDLPIHDVPASVRAYAIEYHFGKAGRKEQARQMHDKFIAGGWTSNRPFELSAAPWAKMFIYTREVAE